MKDDASQFFVFQREHALRFGVQFHLDDGQRVGGGEVALRVPPSGKKSAAPKGMLASASTYNFIGLKTITSAWTLRLGPSATFLRLPLPWCSKRFDWGPAISIL